MLNIDLAPTFAHLAGVAAPELDGRSLIPLLARREREWRSSFLVEQYRGTRRRPPTYCALRKAKTLYVRYQPGAEEFYRLARDPYELENRAMRPAAERAVGRAREQAKALCQPPPPGFSF